MAFGVTEPDAGTDTSRIITRATEDGMGGWIVNGRKIWSSKALESEVYLLLARTDGQPGEFNGLTLFLVDLDPEHCDIAPIPKVGRNAATSCEVAYDDLPVEGWRMVGERPRLHTSSASTPNESCSPRWRVASAKRRCVAPAHYANEREVFGRQIGANQAVSHPLAKAHMELNAAMTMMHRAAWHYDHDPSAANSPTPPSTSPPKHRSSPPTRRCRPTAGSAPASTTSSGTGVRPGCSASPSARR